MRLSVEGKYSTMWWVWISKLSAVMNCPAIECRGKQSMGVEIKLTDNELPVSPVFINFLLRTLGFLPFNEVEWGDQLQEGLKTDQKGMVEEAVVHAEKVLNDERGKKYIARAYQIFVALLTGDTALITEFQLKYHFINVIGVPRNGGSYITKEIYRGLGYDPNLVPNVIAHDGFPEAGPFTFEKGVNSWTNSLQTMAEYLTMVDIYFGSKKPYLGKIIVPKKLTKGTYAGGFFHRVLGESVEHILTIRHPVTSCISTYEKSGGFPEAGKFMVRGNIEEWVRRDIAYTGMEPSEIANMDYFDAYLKYWEQYHTYVATTGLSANKNVVVVPYGRERLMGLVSEYCRKFGVQNPQPEEFKVFNNRERHPDWMKRAEPTVSRIHQLWERVGLQFNLEEVMEAW